MAFFTAYRKATFADSDAAGIIHFSRFAVYVEEAEHLFLQKEGFPLLPRNPEALRWPRIRFQAEYLRPVFPLEDIQIELNPHRVGTSSITWHWKIYRQGSFELSARGEMKTVCCKLDHGQTAPCPLPESLRNLLTETGAGSPSISPQTDPAR